MKVLVALIIFYIHSALYASGPIYTNVDGPNCLNGALVAAKILPYHRYTSNTEMLLKVSSPLCLKVANKEEKKGDIGLISDHGPFSTKEVISHSFMILENGMSFEKHGYGASEAYQTVQTQNILDEYDVGEDKNKTVEYFHCESWDTFYNNKIKKNVDQNLNQSFSELLVIEKKVNEKIITNSSDLLDLKNKIVNLSRKVKVQIKKPLNSKEEFLVKEMAGRLISISFQMSILGDQSLRAITMKWELETQNVKNAFSALAEIALND